MMVEGLLQETVTSPADVLALMGRANGGASSVASSALAGRIQAAAPQYSHFECTMPAVLAQPTG
jgi:hypothetical protein